ncbi:hypothetical protein CRE_06778 [Caenorhabditis remanei]|uniref:BTB domain-containing protein n=1 Tax=Caenorhabditis remanei TaxID=31234 RepID=E3MNS3_CAERE|nr:hypothetical protein CRE_06778 [Caenorhabditis remanei]
MENQEPKIENQFHFENDIGEIHLKENRDFEDQVDKELRLKVSYTHELEMALRLEESSYLTWIFDWDELEKKGVDGFTGCIIVSVRQKNMATVHQKYVFEVTRDVKSLTRRIGSVAELQQHSTWQRCGLNYEVTLQSFSLLSRCLEIDTQFNQSADSDLTLNVERFQLHLNSQFLKFHSKYFSNKLAAYVMDVFLPTLNLPGVRYEAFARLVSMISPNAILPSEEFYDSILELANQLSMPAASRIITQMILRGTHLNFYQVLTFADKHRLDELVDHCLSYISTKDHLQRMKNMESIKLLSAGCSKKILGKYLEIQNA